VTEQSRQAVPGWYGKMPSLGDFASRRVPDEFVRPWDAWLQRVLDGTRQIIGGTWLQRYLVMPMWRFVLLPGLLEPSGWTGLLMPSVDRVGRHFPMTLAVPLPSLHEVAEVLFRREDWYAHLEAIALSALDPTRGPEEFDEAVAGCVLTTACFEDTEERWDTERRLSSVDSFAHRRPERPSEGAPGCGAADGGTIRALACGAPRADAGWIAARAFGLARGSRLRERPAGVVDVLPTRVDRRGAAD
jgi:type VI secretion system ImpM family protein